MKLKIFAIAVIGLVGFQATADIQARIVGGTGAPANLYKFQVSLVSAAARSNYEGHFCGGSLLNATTVVTAAHCVESIGSSNQIKVLVGTHNLNSGGTRINVRQIIKHPNYDKDTFDFDVAILKLAPTPAQRNILNSLPKVVLPSSEIQEPQAAYVSGWGTLQEDSSEIPNRLQHVGVNIVSRDHCNAPSAYDGMITGQMLCAGVTGGGKDSCQGDSGGPLVDARGNRNVLVGIVSNGLGCARSEYPGIYTNVFSLKTWISIRAR